MPAAKKTVEGLLSKVAGKKKVTLTVQNSNGVGTQYTLSESFDASKAKSFVNKHVVCRLLSDCETIRSVKVVEGKSVPEAAKGKGKGKGKGKSAKSTKSAPALVSDSSLPPASRMRLAVAEELLSRSEMEHVDADSVATLLADAWGRVTPQQRMAFIEVLAEGGGDVPPSATHALTAVPCTEALAAFLEGSGEQAAHPATPTGLHSTASGA